jgi:threonine dehydrogenase-like Zn-dependent dehydrogenase
VLDAVGSERAALFGYSELSSQLPGGQAALLRVPQAQFTYMNVPEAPPVVWPTSDRARRRSSSR